MSRETLQFKNYTIDDGAIQVVEIEGAITLSNLFAMQTALREPSTSKSLVIVLAAVPYMDSAGLGVILNSHVSCQKNRRALVLAGVTERVKTLLMITKTDSLFTHAATLEDARSLLQQTKTHA